MTVSFRLALQRAILDSLRHIGGFAVAFFVVGFVVGPVAQEQARLAVAFKGQDVGADAIEEPAFLTKREILRWFSC
jgi:hypothetical protein